MENLKNCIVVDFGVVVPCKTHVKRVNISSAFLVSKIERSNRSPLDDAFSICNDESFNSNSEIRLVVQYKPSLPHNKDFGYPTIHFEDGSTRILYLKGATRGSSIEFSVRKIHFKTNHKISTSQFKFKMANRSNCDDFFCWDFVPEDSDVDIVPHSGIIRADSHLDLTITFTPSKHGLYFRAVPCLFKYHEPLYLDVFGFHSKEEMQLNLDKYIHLNRPITKFISNYCRYLSDSSSLPIANELPVTVSKRYLDFGRIPVDGMGKRGYAVEHLTVTNNDEKDLVVVWNNRKGDFRVDPSKLVLRSLGGSGQFMVSFSPTKPQVISRCEMQAAILWGLRLEYEAPVSVIVHLMGDSFSNEGCGWGPCYSIERTRIVLPGTVPNIPAFTTFKINRTGRLPVQFSLEPIDKTNHFVVKPQEGLIKEDFALIVIQLIPQDRVDVLFNEEWMLTLNKNAQVKLQLCGSCELPFLLTGDEKDVVFPAATLGAYSYLDVPVKNPTRLELEYRCQPSSSDLIRVSKDIKRIGPGETQFISFGFRSPVLGTQTVPQGIWMRWAPYHSAAQKYLKEKEFNTETVLSLTGCAEEVLIHATPESLTMNNVFLKDTATGSFTLSNSGNTMVHIRLRCRVTFIYSRIGDWSITPNDINLGPGQTVQVNIQVVGEEVGLALFEVQYATFESKLFRYPTSEWMFLVHAEVFVFFFSLAVADVRYDGLAKSLSRHVLWSLLRVNSLNEILKSLETGPEHSSSMKIPEYHERTPPLKIDLLLKNKSPIPLWLFVNVGKSCNCPPQKADTLSWRITDYSCIHDDELTAELDRNHVAAGATVILTLLVKYEATAECDFVLDLYISRNPVKKRHRGPNRHFLKVTDVTADPVLVTIGIERGIINGSELASINFLLPIHHGPRSFKFNMEDVYIGDNSKYLQVIWVYNHSQQDNRYWAEWLYVNNRVFKILNPRARVAAYSTYPLFIEFNPFEMKTYDAKLAVVDEVGEEFHISLKATGSVCPYINSFTMLKKMPLEAQFTDETVDIELSQSHFVLGPMPTHSFDKFLFFMKNNSKETICFSWDCLTIWSTIKVMVQPRSGELQPGEIFPLQMHVHTYKNAAILNFVVECMYFNKTKSEQYWKKCKILQKVATTFDSCFVFKPDKEIGVAYHNPTNSLDAGDPPLNKIVSFGGSIRIFNREYIEEMYPHLEQQLKFMPPPKIDLLIAKPVSVSKEQFGGVVDILKVLMRKIVTSTLFQESIKKKRPELRYVDLPDKKQSKAVKLPGRMMAMLLDTLLYTSIMRLFGFEPVVYHDIYPRISGKSQHGFFKMYNSYYENMLRTSISQVCIPPENARMRRTQSRDQLAFVQRLSI